jgi:hypothetical protein
VHLLIKRSRGVKSHGTSVATVRVDYVRCV